MRILFTFSLTLILVFFAKINQIFAQNELSASEHQQKIEKSRQEKNQEFKEESSPLPKEKIADFKGLNYYPIDYQYLVKVKFVKAKKGKKIQIPTSTKRVATYRKYGELIFSLKGQEYRLSVYQSPEIMLRPGYADYLFVPFRDLTSAKETYGGGRYLDFRIPKNEEVWLDFNSAYNPYCAYSHNYSCPIPPKENTLNIAIEAGEKNFEQE